MVSRKKVLFLNVTWRYGSTGNICSALFDACASTDDLKPMAIYGRSYNNKPEENVHCLTSAFYGRCQHFLANVCGIPYGGACLGTNRIISVIRKEKPDLIHIHCINGYFVNIYRLIRFIAQANIPLVLTNHAAFYYTGYCIHPYECEKWKQGHEGCHACPNLDSMGSYFFDRTKTCFRKMKDAFASMKNLTVVSVSPFTFHQSQESVILGKAHNRCILNGVDTKKYHYLNRNRSGSTYTIVCFLPSLASTVKGGDCFFPVVSKIKRDCLIQVIGLNKSVTFSDPRIQNVGMVSSDEVSRYYNGADAIMLLSKTETFSMVVAEAACCGTKTFGFRCGGPESVFGQDYATFVPFGDYEALASLFDADKPDTAKQKMERADKAALEFGQKVMTDHYLSLYREILTSQNNEGAQAS